MVKYLFNIPACGSIRNMNGVRSEVCAAGDIPEQLMACMGMEKAAQGNIQTS